MYDYGGYRLRLLVVHRHMFLGPLEAPRTVLERAGPRVLHGRKQASLLQQLSGVGVFEFATRPVGVETDEATGQTEQQECGQQETTAYCGRARSGRFGGLGGFALLGGNFVLHLLQMERREKRKKGTMSFRVVGDAFMMCFWHFRASKRNPIRRNDCIYLMYQPVTHGPCRVLLMFPLVFPTRCWCW